MSSYECLRAIHREMSSRQQCALGERLEERQIGEDTHHTGSFKEMAVKRSPIERVKRPRGGLPGMEEEAEGEGMSKQKGM